MGGRRYLKNGAPRLLGNHGGMEGAAYRRAYADLAEEFDLSSAFLRFEAGRVAALRVQLEAGTKALAAAQRSRRLGKGRRPNAQQIERLSRRAGLADGSYAQALARLEHLAPRRSRGALTALLGGRQ